MVILLATLLMQQPPSATGGQPQVSPPTGIEWSRLPREIPAWLEDSARFGYLRVPRDHADPDGPRIRIAIALLPARSAESARDPVVFIPGGPGISGIETYTAHMALSDQFHLYREQRDLIIIDPRGHGYSDPQMCSDLNGLEPLLVGSPAAERLWLSRLASCRDRLRSAGVRVETLSAVQAAHDLELLRLAVGASHLNLFGSSYGSRIAAEAMREVPSTIRAVHFSGPVPPGRYRGVVESEVVDQALDALVQRCAAHAECRNAYPRLAADYDTLLTRLRRSPVLVPVPWIAEPAGAIEVDDDLMRLILTQHLMNRQVATGAPLLIHSLADGDVDLLAHVVPQLLPAAGNTHVDATTRLSFLCNDGVINSVSVERQQERCRVWLGESYTGQEAEHLRSDIPALITSGDLDPLTPPSFARFLAHGLSQVQLVDLPSHGHERPPACGFRISRAFFDLPEQRQTTTCLDSIAPMQFVTGVVPSRWIANMTAGTASNPWLVSVPACAGLLLLVGIVASSMREFRARRPEWSRGYVTHISVPLVAALGLTCLILTAAAVVISRREHSLIPLVGLPQEWAWLLALPWLLLAFTSITAVLLIADRNRTSPSAVLIRSTTLPGATLLLAFWCYNVIL